MWVVSTAREVRKDTPNEYTVVFHGPSLKEFLRRLWKCVAQRGQGTRIADPNGYSESMIFLFYGNVKVYPFFVSGKRTILDCVRKQG